MLKHYLLCCKVVLLQLLHLYKEATKNSKKKTTANYQDRVDDPLIMPVPLLLSEEIIFQDLVILRYMVLIFT